MTEPRDHIVTTSAAGPMGSPAPMAPRPDPLARGGQHAPNGPDGVGGAIPDGQPSTGLVQPRDAGLNGEVERGTTAAQLRRFIKSRSYVPLHELRRRFELNGDCDDVLAIETPDGRAYIGLPAREGRFIADLVRQGEIGLELGHDPEVPIVVGVFPMRPVGR